MAVIYTGRAFAILECNQTACGWFGMTREEMLGRHLTSFLWSSPLAMPALLESAEMLWLRSGNQAFPAEVTRHPVADGDEGCLWILYDGNAERAAHDETSRRLLDSREAERLRLARELHDGAIQELIAIGFGLADAPATPGLIQQRQALRGVVSQLRTLVCELRPAGLTEFGLVPSLEGLLAKLVREHTGPSPELRLELQELPELSLPEQLCFYRSAQEATNNSLRHAGASHITVRLQRVGPLAELTIEDDGCGFQVPASLRELTRSQHYGLAGMAERTALMNGSLGVDSTVGRGTTVRLTLQTHVSQRQGQLA